MFRKSLVSQIRHFERYSFLEKEDVIKWRHANTTTPSAGFINIQFTRPFSPVMLQ